VLLLEILPFSMAIFISYILLYSRVTELSRIMDTEKTLVIFALIAALGLVTVVAVNVMLTAQEAEAACEKGRPGPAINASKGRCLDRGTI
jgi:hypothetical protein